MTELTAFMTLRTLLLSSLGAHGLADVKIISGRQPTKAGLLDNSIYMFPISETVQTVQQRSYSPDGSAGIAGVERVRVTKTIQLQAFRRMPPDDVSGPTATDLVATARMILQSLHFIEKAREEGLGISGFTQIREPEFINAAGDYEKNPSFDFDLGFLREIRPAAERLTGIAPGIHGV